MAARVSPILPMEGVSDQLLQAINSRFRTLSDVLPAAPATTTTTGSSSGGGGGTPVAGSQTPWLSDIDGAGFALNNPGSINAGAAGGDTVYITADHVTWRKNGSHDRWDLVIAVAEATGNVGSDFYVQRFANDDTYLGHPLYINRATGYIGINDMTTPTAPLHVKGVAGQAAIYTNVGLISSDDGFTTSQAVYLSAHSSIAGLNSPAAGFGGLAYKGGTSGSEYWYYNATAGAWFTVDFAATGGSGGSPGGVDQSVQFKVGTAFNGDTNLKWDWTNRALRITGAHAGTVPDPYTPGLQVINAYITSDGGLQTSSSAYNAINVQSGGILARTGTYTDSISVSSDSNNDQLTLTWIGPATGSTPNQYAYIAFNRNRGTAAAPTQIADGDFLGGLQFYGSGQGGTGILAKAVQVATTTPHFISGELDFYVGTGVNDGAGNTKQLLALILNYLGASFAVPMHSVGVVLESAGPPTYPAYQGGYIDLKNLAGGVNYPVPFPGTTFGSGDALLWSGTDNATPTPITATHLCTNCYMNAAAGFVTQQSLQLKGHTTVPSDLNVPGTGYGGLGFRQNATYWYFDDTTGARGWKQIDFNIVAAGLVPGGVDQSIQLNKAGAMYGEPDLTWDYTNKALNLKYASGSSGLFPFVGYIRSRGTVASPTTISAGDILGGENYYGYTGSAQLGASIRATAVGISSGTNYVQGAMSLMCGNGDGNIGTMLQLRGGTAAGDRYAQFYAAVGIGTNPAALNGLQLQVKGISGFAGILSDTGFIQSDGGFLVTNTNTQYNTVQTSGGIVALGKISVYPDFARDYGVPSGISTVPFHSVTANGNGLVIVDAVDTGSSPGTIAGFIGRRGISANSNVSGPYIGASANLTNGLTIMSMGGRGSTTGTASGWTTSATAAIGFVTSENWGAASWGSEITFAVTPNGQNTRFNKMWLHNAGQLEITGQTTDPDPQKNARSIGVLLSNGNFRAADSNGGAAFCMTAAATSTNLPNFSGMGGIAYQGGSTYWFYNGATWGSVNMGNVITNPYSGVISAAGYGITSGPGGGTQTITVFLSPGGTGTLHFQGGLFINMTTP